MRKEFFNVVAFYLIFFLIINVIYRIYIYLQLLKHFNKEDFHKNKNQLQQRKKNKSLKKTNGVPRRILNAKKKTLFTH